MNLKAICKKLVFVSLCAGMAGSIGGCSSAQPVFPLSTLPDEMKEEYNPSIDIVNTLEQSRTVTDDTEINPNSILAESSFDVYFDNTTGCFLGYVKAKEKE